MDETNALLQILTSKLQNGETGAFSEHRFRAEAAAFVLLACWPVTESTRRAALVTYLKRHQLPNGCWPAVAPLREPSNWATALMAYLFALVAADEPCLPAAIAGLVSARPREANWFWRWKFRTSDTAVRFDPAKYGWSWIPNAGSWVIPTAMTVIALEKARKLGLVRGREVEDRLELAYAMLLDRMCQGGGWNVGNSVVYGVPLAAHVEATALALLALRYRPTSPGIEPSLCWLSAQRPRSAFSKAWQVLALRGYEATQSCRECENELATLVRDARQIDDETTLALSVLALRGDQFGGEHP